MSLAVVVLVIMVMAVMVIEVMAVDVTFMVGCSYDCLVVVGNNKGWSRSIPVMLVMVMVGANCGCLWSRGHLHVRSWL